MREHQRLNGKSKTFGGYVPRQSNYYTLIEVVEPVSHVFKKELLDWGQIEICV
jgi:hypothetical protein